VAILPLLLTASGPCEPSRESMPGASASERPVGAGFVGRRAFDALASAYGGRGELPIDSLVGTLETDPPSPRRATVDYLLALCRQSVADERDGRTPWITPHTFGDSDRNEAHLVRKQIGDALARGATSAEAAPLLEWLIEREPSVDIQNSAAAALARGAVPIPESVLSRWLEPEFKNRRVLLSALAVVQRDSLVALLPAVAKVCSDPRESVRRAAHAVLAAFGAEGASDQAPADRITPAIAQDLEAIARMVHPVIPNDARMVRIIAVPPDPDSTRRRNLAGWMLSEDDSSMTILDVFGQSETYTRSRAAIVPTSVAEEARFLASTRTDHKREVEAPFRTEIGSSLHAGVWSVPEALVAACAFERGDSGSAAALVLPALDTLDRADQLRSIPAQELGARYDAEMIKRFACNRDYPAAIALAHHLLEPEFDALGRRGLAEELAQQLPRRDDDFKSLRLPTPDAWQALSARLTRHQQVDYLLERLRLVNAFQWSNPGGLDLFGAQYASAWHHRHIYEEEPNTSAEVIHPLRMLYEMRLQVTELPWLFDRVLDDDYILAVEFPFGFDADQLHYRVGDLVEKLIQETARFKLADRDALKAMSPPGRRRAFAAMTTWCRRHAGDDVGTLERLALQTTKDRWHFVSLCNSRDKVHDERAIPIILARSRDFPGLEHVVAATLYRMDSPLAVPWARAHAVRCGWQSTYTQVEASFHSALILLAHGDRSRFEGLDVLDRIDEVRPDGNYMQRAASVLSTFDADALQRARCLALDWQRIELRVPGDDQRLRRLLERGCPNAFEWAETELESETPSGTISLGVDSTGTPVRFPIFVGDQLAVLVAMWKGGPPYRMLRPEAERRADRSRLADWLRAQHARLDRGERLEFTR